MADQTVKGNLVRQARKNTSKKAHNALLPAEKWAYGYLFMPKGEGTLTTQSIIYGMGAGVLMAVSLYFFFTGLWLTGLLVLFPCVSLVGFAVHFLDYH